MGIIPFVQISPNSHIAFPVVLAADQLRAVQLVGIRKQGVGKYFKDIAVPAGRARGAMYILVIPIELPPAFVVRPFTLAVRLFANMFAGHMMLLVFTLGGFYLLHGRQLLGSSSAPVSFADGDRA